MDDVDDLWDLDPAEPTNLIALWPEADPPGAEDFARRWSAALDADVTVREVEPDDPAIAWCALLEIEDDAAEVVVWVEPARPLPPDELARLGAEPGRWVVGIEAPLDASDPLSAFVRLLRGLAVALPEAPAILDVNTTRWHGRPELSALRDDAAVEPAADVLWVIQLVTGDGGGDEAEAPTWLHTHGLARCGAPELEMIGVPSRWAPAAADVLSDAAALLLGEEWPGPGGTIEIGMDLSVRLRPWDALADRVAPGSPGGADGRDMEAHGGARAVLCAVTGAPDDAASWPEDVVRRVQGGEAAVYLTARETDRRSRLARAGWSAFVAAARRAAPEVARFAIEVPFGEGEKGAAREHLWLEVVAIEADRVRGRLAHAPSVVSDPVEGEEVWITPDRVSDWRMFTPDRVLGPADAAGLGAHLDGARATGAEGGEPP